MNDILPHIPQFIGHHPLLVGAFIVIVLALIGLEGSRHFRGFKELTPAGLTHLINRDDALVVDVSPQADFEKAHVPGSRHVAVSQFDPENKELKKARELPIVTVCRNGAESAKAARRLVKAGFTRVYTLSGGIDAWRRADLPLAKGRN
ncbi:MAG TPA: rhodanese-like domain-containing protein [Rhodanobacteraceae bacterium]|nr:rhodanese-like domain-containing protein [Rhodanobacteraceae bacterium]